MKVFIRANRRFGLAAGYFITGLFILMLIAGCESKDKAGIDNPARGSEPAVYQSNPNVPELRAELEREYAAWKSLRIQNYEFKYVLGDTGIVEIVTVKDGVPQHTVNPVTDEVHDINDGGVNPLIGTIDALFDRIEKDFSNDENKKYPLTGQIGTYFSIRYDPKYHYPVKYDSIDKYDPKIGGVVGNGWGVDIDEFTVLEESKK